MDQDRSRLSRPRAGRAHCPGRGPVFRRCALSPRRGGARAAAPGSRRAGPGGVLSAITGGLVRDHVSRTRIKICGITSPEDGRMAAAAGVDAIGLVFHPDSPRAVSVATANAVCAALPPFVTAVGLFVDPERDQVAQVLDGCPLDILQFHGDESPELCNGFGRRFLKAVRMGEGSDPAAAGERYGAHRLLLDAYVPGQPGGTGRTFRWSAVPPWPLPLNWNPLW